jgi:hypothetical protein
MVTIHLLSRDMADRMLGATSVMGMATPGAHVVKVLYQRIDQMSNRRNQPTGSLLGHAIAHEIGHLFLPPNPHVLIGIMGGPRPAAGRKRVAVVHPRPRPGDSPERDCATPELIAVKLILLASLTVAQRAR